MSKRNKEVWVSARNQLEIPLPPCPDEVMSEPQYASLVFEECCMVELHCSRFRNMLKSRTRCKQVCDADASLSPQFVSYAAGIRFCGRCWGAKCVSMRSFISLILSTNQTLLSLKVGSLLAEILNISGDPAFGVVLNLLPAALDFRVCRFIPYSAHNVYG